LIPVNDPLLSAREEELVLECLRSGWISSAGTFIDEFEQRWAAYCGRRYGIAVANGTAALQLALKCIGLKPADEVIIPSFTIISCALAVIYNGGLPVLVDSDPRTWCIDPERIREKLTPRTRAIMPVHIYGHPADMDPLLEIAQEHNLAIIEDAAEAHGAQYLCGRGSAAPVWRRCGGFGEFSCFSFYANKLVTTGEGGMLLTDDPVLAERARSLRNLCFQTDRRFHHEDLGFNFRLTNLQAALGVAQLERMDQIVARKRTIGQTYGRLLADIDGLTLAPEESWAKNVYWMYGVVLSEKIGIEAAEFAARLKNRGVETRPFFLGMHEQPVFRKRGLFLDDRHPVTERLARRGLYLPSGLALTDEQINDVVQAIHGVLQ
jgi:perosamine synthetase